MSKIINIIKYSILHKNITNFEKQKKTIYLIGNPNTGKTMLYNMLTGKNDKVANYSGVSVQTRMSQIKLLNSTNINLIDLPGSYSMYPRSKDESLTISKIIKIGINNYHNQLILAVIDAINLERNLYFLHQIIELGKPMIIALTMMDIAQKNNYTINIPLLEKRLNIKIIPISYKNNNEIKKFKIILYNQLMYFNFCGKNISNISSLPTNNNIQQKTIIMHKGLLFANRIGSHTISNTTLLQNLGLLEFGLSQIGENSIKQYLNILPDYTTTLEYMLQHSIILRYKKIEQILKGIIKKDNIQQYATIKIDRIILNPILGPICLILIFGTIFEILFYLPKTFITHLEYVTIYLETIIKNILYSYPLLNSLINHGIIAGITSVMSFIPLIALLFFLIGILEDSGYLARATFILDKLMCNIGLPGKAFIPLLSGFICTIPAIMTSRIIESKKDRLLTILILPLISCSARLPIYYLLTSTLFSHMPLIYNIIQPATIIIIIMYLLGIGIAFLIISIMKTIFNLNNPTPLILELPIYRLPKLIFVLKNTIYHIKRFIIESGIIIFIMSIFIWILCTFPYDNTKHITLNNYMPNLEHSYAGKIGKYIEPIIKPLGFNWKIGIGIIGSFTAREVFISTLSIIHKLDNNHTNSSQNTLKDYILNEKYPNSNKLVYSPLVGLSLMAFFALSMQCTSTLIITKKETKSFKWPIMQFIYMSIIAWITSYAIFQIGKFFKY